MRSLNYTYAEMLLSRGLAILGSFGVAILTARVLGPADRGRYYYVITLAAVGVQFASFGIHSSNSYLIARTPGLLAASHGQHDLDCDSGRDFAAAGVLVFDFAIGGRTTGLRVHRGGADAGAITAASSCTCPILRSPSIVHAPSMD